MHVSHSNKMPEKASEKPGLSRRGFLAAGGGAALAVPTVAAASIAPPRTDDELFNDLVGQLKTVLQRMHPIVDRASWHLDRRTDGSFYLMMQGFRDFDEFTGAGLYDISVDGYVMTYWVERMPADRAGYPLHIPMYDAYRGKHWYENEYVDDWRRLGRTVNIVRKHESGEAPDA